MAQTSIGAKRQERDGSGRFVRQQIEQHPRSRPVDRKDLALIRRIVEKPLETQVERAQQLCMGLSTVQHREGRHEFARALAGAYWRGIARAAAALPSFLLETMLRAERDSDRLKASAQLADLVKQRRDYAEVAGIIDKPTAPQAAPTAQVMVNLLGNLPADQQAPFLAALDAQQQAALDQALGRTRKPPQTLPDARRGEGRGADPR